MSRKPSTNWILNFPLPLLKKCVFTKSRQKTQKRQNPPPQQRNPARILHFQLSNVCSLLIELTNCWRSVIVILKNIKFRSLEKGLQLYFSQNVSKFSEDLVINYFNLHFIFKFQKNGVQSDIAYINLSYPLALPVCTDRIINTFKLMQMDLIVS